MRVVCVGDCGIDHYLPSGEKRLGGITANFARHARDQFAQEDDIRIVSCVGDDADGGRVLAALEAAAIGCHITTLAGMTPVQYIEVQPDGERRFVRYEEGVLQSLRFSHEQKAVIADGDLVVAPVYLQIVGLFDELMSIECGGTVAIDFADFLQHPDFSLLERYVGRIDAGFFGLKQDCTAEIDAIRRLASEHDKTFVVTLGAAGSVAFSGATETHCAAVPVDRVVDTTGAGDAFAAGFLAGFCRGKDMRVCMGRGAQLAARVVAHAGSYPEASSG